MGSNAKVLNIITRDEEESAILNKESLKEILLQTNVKDYPVAFYSICGTKRTGKSFLWNLFVHYLKNKSNYLNESKSKASITKHFEWKAGVKRHTEGILVYKEPFFLETSKYGKVALFLMDTQGMFDNIESGENCGMIVALSFLISSIQIYNVHHLIESCHLQYSYKFSKVWKVVTDKDDEVEGSHLGSSLMFVVRDWKKKRTYKLGLEGGKKCVRNLMEIHDSQAEDQRHVRREIQDNFLDVSGCLLPEPGDDIVDEDPETSGCLFNEVAMGFYEYSKGLFEYLCSSKNIVVKTVNGKPVKAFELYENLLKISEEGKGFAGVPENFRSFVEHDYKTKIRKLILECLNGYIEEMCNKFKDHVENDYFEWRKLIQQKEKVEKKELLEETAGSSETVGETSDRNENSNAENNTEDDLVDIPLQDDDDSLLSDASNQNDEASRAEDENTKSRWQSFIEKFKKKNFEDEDQKRVVNWKEVLEEHHTNLKNKALDEYDKAPKPGDDLFKQRWRKILERLIDKNYDQFQNCTVAEDQFNTLLIEYNKVLRSNASGERLKRTFHPMDSARDRCKEALQSCKEIMIAEIDQSIAKSCFECFREKANILLNEHRNRIKRRIGISVAAFATVAGAAAAATLFAIPAILAGAIASEVSTAVIISATVGGGATLAAGISSAGTAVKLYRNHIHSVLEENWDYDGDDLGFIKADIEVLLSFGILRLPQVTQLEKKK